MTYLKSRGKDIVDVVWGDTCSVLTDLAWGERALLILGRVLQVVRLSENNVTLKHDECISTSRQAKETVKTEINPMSSGKSIYLVFVSIANL